MCDPLSIALMAEGARVERERDALRAALAALVLVACADEDGDAEDRAAFDAAYDAAVALLPKQEDGT